MNLKKFGDHTLDADRIKPGCVLDAGCRDYDFALAILAFSPTLQITCLDIDDDVIRNRPNRPRLVACQLALVAENYPYDFVGRVLAGNGSRVIDGNEVPTIKLSSLPTKMYPYEAVKLDIEGSEYDVLLTWPGPVADQITVEYHEHTGQGKAKHGADIYDRIAKHLGQWYSLVQDDPMDTLWVLKP